MADSTPLRCSISVVLPVTRRSPEHRDPLPRLNAQVDAVRARRGRPGRACQKSFSLRATAVIGRIQAGRRNQNRTCRGHQRHRPLRRAGPGGRHRLRTARVPRPSKPRDSIARYHPLTALVGAQEEAPQPDLAIAATLGGEARGEVAAGTAAPFASAPTSAASTSI